MTEEREVWSGTPSQVINLPTFVVCVLLFFLIIPVFYALWRWLVVKMTKYELTTERLRTRYGVLNRKTDELELYRVRDYKFDQPWYLRLFSLGNLVLTTSDKSHPVVIISAIQNGEQLREQLRTHVEACRVAKRVREVDFE
ncbi:MAG: PH domain-containing protein [Gammaproteobacteria bacterium]